MAGVVIAALILGLSDSPGLSDSQILAIGRHRFYIEIADEAEEHTRGLSGRPSLGPKAGMLFIFPQPAKYGFWMKEMNFPLDFVWISGTKIIGTTQNVPPVCCDFYYPPEGVDKVLEINAGQVEKFDIKPGDSVVIELE